jgi:hypothetical protein
VWHSRSGLAAEKRKAGREKPKTVIARDLPDFIAPQLCETLDRPPADGWTHEIKFDGYRIQMRVLNGEASLKTRKGLDWTTRYPAIARAAGSGRTQSSMARYAPSTRTARRISRLFKRLCPKAERIRSSYFAFDLLIEGGGIYARFSSTSARSDCSTFWQKPAPTPVFATSSTSRPVERRCCARLAGCRLKEACRSLGIRLTCRDGRTRG